MNQSNRIVQGSELPTAPTGPRALLERLTGPSKSKVSWLFADSLAASIGPDRRLRIAEGDQSSKAPPQTTTLSWSRNSYRIQAQGERPIWVNGRRVERALLRHGERIEFEEHGPWTRYRLGGQPFPRYWPVEEILSEAWAYARSSRRPLRDRIATALGEGLRRTAVQTTLAFGASVIFVLCLLAGLGMLLYQNDRKIEERLEQEARRIEAVTLLLAQTRDDALSRRDLAALQQQLETRLDQQTDRLGSLERQSDAASRVIAACTPSVAFVQRAFGLRRVESGALLKQVMGPDNEVIRTPFGQPLLDPFGNGPPAEFHFTGTAFLLEGGQLVVTNRHVAQPWASNELAMAFRASGLIPEMLKQVIYFPGVADPVETMLLGVSETADIAVLTIAPARIEGRGLSVSPAPPRAGDEVFPLGYPTGRKVLLA